MAIWVEITTHGMILTLEFLHVDTNITKILLTKFTNVSLFILLECQNKVLTNFDNVVGMINFVKCSLNLSQTL